MKKQQNLEDIFYFIAPLNNVIHLLFGQKT